MKLLEYVLEGRDKRDGITARDLTAGEITRLGGSSGNVEKRVLMWKGGRWCG